MRTLLKQNRAGECWCPTAEGMAVTATIDTMFLALGSGDTALFWQTVTDDFYILSTLVGGE